MYCVFCIAICKDDAEQAVTIMNGQAVCYDHSYYVQGGEYNRILALIKRDEMKSDEEILSEEIQKEDRFIDREVKRFSKILRGL